MPFHHDLGQIIGRSGGVSSPAASITTTVERVARSATRPPSVPRTSVSQLDLNNYDVSAGDADATSASVYIDLPMSGLWVFSADGSSIGGPGTFSSSLLPYPVPVDGGFSFTVGPRETPGPVSFEVTGTDVDLTVRGFLLRQTTA